MPLDTEGNTEISLIHNTNTNYGTNSEKKSGKLQAKGNSECSAYFLMIIALSPFYARGQADWDKRGNDNLCILKYQSHSLLLASGHGQSLHLHLTCALSSVAQI